MMLGEDVLHSFQPLQFFETDQNKTPMTVHLPLGWVSNAPLRPEPDLFSTCFMDATQRGTDSELADQIRSRYDLESYGAYRQLDSRSTADARVQKILQENTYHVGMLYADDQFYQPSNFLSALVQLKYLSGRSRSWSSGRGVVWPYVLRYTIPSRIKPTAEKRLHHSRELSGVFGWRNTRFW